MPELPEPVRQLIDSSSVGLEERSASLLVRVKAKREEVIRQVAKLGPRRRRLTDLAIFCGSVAALLTAAPALGGKSFADWVGETFQLTVPFWQVLCAGAAVCSLIAAVSTQLLKAHDLEAKLVRAQVAAAKLEAIATGLEFSGLDLARAAEEYARCVEDTAFTQLGDA